MCGIYGCVGKNVAFSTVITGLEKLQYRGYDSSGLAGINETGKLIYFKANGPVSQLQKLIHKNSQEGKLDVIVGHTRWATHGDPSDKNSHPQFDTLHQCAVVHNGIIENYEELKDYLEKKGIIFVSNTDTEVIPHLITHFYKGDLLKAVKQANLMLEGRFAFVVIHKDFPQQLLCVSRETPVIIGKGSEHIYVSSDAQAFSSDIHHLIYLQSGEAALVSGEHMQIYNDLFEEIHPDRWKKVFHKYLQKQDKGDYAHHMLKEMWEQPQAIDRIFSHFINKDEELVFNELTDHMELFEQVKKVVLIGCGSSYHAALLMAYFIEDRFGISASAEIASEFRYRNPVIDPHTLAVVISQSGETADTLATLTLLKSKQIFFTLGICNEENSSLVRETDVCTMLYVGKEVGVASTKAFTGQLMVMLLLFLKIFSFQNKISKSFIKSLKKIPYQIQELLKKENLIEALINKYFDVTDFFFLGRNYTFPIACEGALKLKEIAYLSAQGYPAGEMKHGPLALVGPTTLTIAFCGDHLMNEKIKNNLAEIKTRKGSILAVVTDREKRFSSVADDIISIPDVPQECIPILMAVVGQMFAYYMALKRGTHIDCPRNLAKSVTVE